MKADHPKRFVSSARPQFGRAVELVERSGFVRGATGVEFAHRGYVGSASPRFGRPVFSWAIDLDWAGQMTNPSSHLHRLLVGPLENGVMPVRPLIVLSDIPRWLRARLRAYALQALGYAALFIFLEGVFVTAPSVYYGVNFRLTLPTIVVGNILYSLCCWLFGSSKAQFKNEEEIIVTAGATWDKNIPYREHSARALSKASRPRSDALRASELKGEK